MPPPTDRQRKRNATTGADPPVPSSNDPPDAAGAVAPDPKAMAWLDDLRQHGEFVRVGERPRPKVRRKRKRR
jgi:hypothetical protein